MTSRIYRHPSEPAGPVPEETVETNEDAAGAGGTVPPADEVTRLKSELEATKAESEQWRDRFLRKAAEFDNFRKRTEREKLDFTVLAKSSVVLEFLPIMDACERALASMEDRKAEDQTLDQYREGVQLLYKQLSDTLKRVGVVPVDAVGKAFDPNIHEALTREETSEYEENTVTREFRRGYLYKDRLLRPSQVVVSSRPQQEKPGNS